jgi:hypothetical protein
MARWEVLPWERAKAEISESRPDGAYYLDDLFKSQPQKSQRKFKTLAVEYDYGECIIDNGTPVLPLDAPGIEDFLVSDRLPLGFITRNACEVCDYIAIDGANIRIANTILYPGEFLGLFEVADLLTEVPNPSEPAWNVYSGVISIDAIPNLATRQNRSKLARAYGQPIGDLSMSDAYGLINQLKVLPVFHDISRNWRVRVIYLSREWIDVLRRMNPSEAAGRVRESLLRRAWKNLARIRGDEATILNRKFRDAVQSLQGQYSLADSAANFLRLANDILAGRRPGYVPLSQNSANGPFGDIAERILAHITEHKSVLCPAYLSSTGAGDQNAMVGYLKVAHAAPHIALRRNKGSHKERVVEMMNVLRLAVQREREDGGGTYLIERYMDVLKHVTFRTPEVGGGKPAIYRVRIDPQTSVAAAEDVDPDTFYRGVFTTPPNERCAFFLNSVRIDRTKADEVR